MRKFLVLLAGMGLCLSVLATVVGAEGSQPSEKGSTMDSDSKQTAGDRLEDGALATTEMEPRVDSPIGVRAVEKTVYEGPPERPSKSGIEHAAPPAPIGPCASITTFQDGCLISGGPWSGVYNEFATANGIESNSGGARVQMIESRTGSLDRVMYVVGPYLPAYSAEADYGSVQDEWAAVAVIAPGMAAVEAVKVGRDVSVVYIGFGRFEDSQLPVAQRVVATKAAITQFENLRNLSLGRSPESTALIGVSLGGVVGKIALSELESEGFDHGVETYVSYDSPHWGVYTPPALQYVPVYLESAFGWLDSNLSWANVFGDNHLDDSERAAAAFTGATLKSPVAQDMMAVNLAYDGWRSPNIGYIQSRYRQLPTTSRNVAVASGSTFRQRPVLGDEYFSVRTGDSGNELKFRLEIDAKIPSEDKDPYFFGRTSYKSITGGGFLGLPTYERIYHTRDNNSMSIETIRNFERAPCAHSTETVDLLVKQLNYGLSNSKWSGFSMEATENRACFVPTFSAVIGDVGSDGPIAGVSQFDRVIGDSVNKNHLSVTPTMNQSIADELATVFPAEEGLNQTPTSPDDDPGPVKPPIDPDVIADIIGGVADTTVKQCTFVADTQDLEEARAMFPEKCGRPFNLKTDRCDLEDDGWHCSGPRKSVIGKFDNLFKPDGLPATSSSGSGSADASQPEVHVGGLSADGPGGGEDTASAGGEAIAGSDCVHDSGTHSLDEARSMFAQRCGRAWNPEIDKCEYSDAGWRCYQNN